MYQNIRKFFKIPGVSKYKKIEKYGAYQNFKESRQEKPTNLRKTPDTIIVEDSLFIKMKFWRLAETHKLIPMMISNFENSEIFH